MLGGVKKCHMIKTSLNFSVKKKARKIPWENDINATLTELRNISFKIKEIQNGE